MTILADPAAVPARLSGRAARPSRLLVALAAGLGVLGILTTSQTIAVWQTGAFGNPDDAMRAVEVRDFMAGQGWYDLVPHRLSPDYPFVMHWSRLVDLPLAAMIGGLETFVSPDRAERLVRIAEPVLLYLASLALMAGLVRNLIGPRAMLPAALLLGGSVDFVSNFIPGHIHHHAVQATLLLAATKALFDALGAARRPGLTAALSGCLAAVSLGIGLQNLPFVAGLAGLVVLAWVRGGERRAALLTGFGLGLGLTAAAVFVVDVPPGHYGDPVCDAFSAAHLVACLVAGGCFATLPLLSRITGLAVLARSDATKQSRRASRQDAGLLRCARNDDPEGSELGMKRHGYVSTHVRHGSVPRLLAALIVGGLTLLCVHVTAPACLHDPMAGVDPILRTQWLAGVGEALPLMTLVHLKPAAGLGLLATLLVGLAASVWATCRASAVTRERWFALTVLGFGGCIVMCWQVRAAASTEAFLVPAGVAAVLTVFDRVSRQPGRPALLAATVAALFACGAGWSALASQLEPLVRAQHASGPSGAEVDPSRCFAPDAYEALAALPPGLVLSTVDPGSTILAATHHSVLAAPYHRNSYGNRVALLALPAPPEEARGQIADAKVRYVALCRSSNETAETVRLHPDSLSAKLMAGTPPPWLTPLVTKGSEFVVYGVEPH